MIGLIMWYFLMPNKHSVYKECVSQNVLHPEIVTAQSILETGHYKSRVCIEYNNLFGLYDSKNGDYYKFNTWQESVKGYKNMIQYKYKGGDYYKFLEDIGYASAKNYTSVLRVIDIK